MLIVSHTTGIRRTRRAFRVPMVLASLVLLFMVVMATAYAATLVFLVKDINTQTAHTGSAFPSVTAPGNPRTAAPRSAVIGSVIYFAADDGVNGRELWAYNSAVPTTTLVANINVNAGAGSDPDWFTVINGLLYFSADDGVTGRELWVYNPSSGTVSLVNPSGSTTGINTGAADANPANLTIVGSQLFFSAGDGAGALNHGTELWIITGTGAAPVLVKDIYAGAPSAGPSWLTEFNGKLYFSANDGTNGTELWVSDGTSAGTLMVNPLGSTTGIRAGVEGSGPAWLTAVGSLLFFAADDGAAGDELWKSDGTPTNTLRVKDIRVGSSGSYPTWLTANAVSNTLYFVADDGVRGRELWKSESPYTQGTTALVKNIKSGSDGSNPNWLTVAGAKLFFAANDGVNGEELWVSDGSNGGTVLISPLAGTSGIHPNANGANPLWLTAFGANVVFAADDGTSGVELWTSDGAVATRVADIHPGVGGAEIAAPAVMGGNVYFAANDGQKGRELWMSSGAAGNASRVADINRTAAESEPMFMTYNSQVTKWFFSAHDGVNGRELWMRDSAGNTSLLANINTMAGVGSEPSEFRNLGSAGGNNTVFVANDGAGRALWRTDGTPLFTLKVSGSALDPANLVVLSATVYFVANEGVNGRELWKSDGATASLVGDINPTGSADPDQLIRMGGMLYFTANDGAAHGRQLWKYNPASNSLITLTAGSLITVGVNPSLLTAHAVSNTLYFVADDGVNGRELWKTDGTLTGTRMISDINPLGDANPTNLTVVSRTLFFAADDGVNGRELWKTDGTVTGTVMVANINPGAAGSNTGNFTEFGDKLLFVASFFARRELFVSDGATYQQISSINGFAPVSIGNIRVVSSTLAFFAANDGVTGVELYKTDGTSAGTGQVKDIKAGGGSSSPLNLTDANSRLYFAANDGAAGVELWTSDGTTTGTQRVVDIAAGAMSSAPSPGGFTRFQSAAGYMLFSANDGAKGRELWALFFDPKVIYLPVIVR